MASKGNSPSRRGASPRRRKCSAADKSPGWHRHPLCRFVVVAGLFAIFLFLFVAALILFNFDRRAARYDIEAVGQLPMPSEVLDASGGRLGYLHGEHVGIPVPLDRISPHFIDALVAREDSRFFRHNGIDRIGLVRAWLRNVKEKRTVQGGSTITMQLTRMTFGLTERTMQRKLLEMALARRLEKHYSKEEILSQYVNRIFLGTGMNGIEQGAQGYFGKSSADLTLPEAAMIAGVIRAPNGFSPFRHYEIALREMRGTILRMEDEGMISKEDAKLHAEAKPTVLSQDRWMEMLRQQSKISGQTYLLKMVEDRIAEIVPSYSGVGGLIIQTTFDARLQDAAERSVNRNLSEWEALPDYPHPLPRQHTSGPPLYLQGAVTVVENYTGAIRALVGGRDFSHSSFNRATQSRRTMGSIFKPLVYGTAFERGLFPGMLVSDARIEPGEIHWDRKNWSPENADGIFGDLLPAKAGLIRSRNTMTARVGEWAGIETVLTMMEHAGLGDIEGERSPTIYIGTRGAGVRDVASAYSVFATGGVRHRPHFITSVRDRDDILRYQHQGESYRVLSPGASWLTSNILKQVLEEGGTGGELRESGFTAPAGGKTGTTNDFHDAWFAGYTSRLSACVWVGLDQPGTIMKGAYGSRIALPIWRDIMLEAETAGYEFTEFAAPEEVIEMQLCRVSGKLASAECETAGTVYVENVPHDLIPRAFCAQHGE